MSRHLFVALFLAVLLLPVSRGFAEDAAPSLAEELKQLRAEVRALAQRVATLEQKEAQRVGLVGLVGTYELDRRAFEVLLLEGALKASAVYLGGIEDDAKRARARENIEQSARKQADAAELTLTLAPDGSFEMRAQLDGASELTGGTWERTGAEVVLTTTQRDNEPVRPHEVSKVQIAAGALHLQPLADDPIALVLRKR